MTVMEIPSVGYYLGMKIANSLAGKERSKAVRKGNKRATVRSVVQSFFRFVLHLAGFSLLTMAGFSWNIPAGLITAGISCFLLSTLITGNSRNVDSDTEPLRR